MATTHEVAGPCAWYVGSGAAGALEFLGWCEGETRVSLVGAEDEIRTDLGGPANPTDVQWMGEQAFVSGDLSRWDKAVLRKLKSRLPGGGSAVSGGSYAFGALGSLMIAEGYAVRFLIRGGYAASKSFNAGDPPIYNFLAAWPGTNFDVGLSTRASRFRMTMRAIPKLDFTTGNSVLYNLDVSGLPSIG